ncbi:MAG: RNA polymerase sigma factor [Pyrinomonadaceae bacterium]
MTDKYENLSDNELVECAVNGNEEAFGEIVRRFSPRVFRFAGRFFRSYSLIEEAAQEVFLKAFVQFKNFEGRGSFEGWLTRITINTCINLLRNAKRQPELSVSDLSGDESDFLDQILSNAHSADYRDAEQKLITADLVKRLLDTLPPEDALILTMIDGDGASIKEVAALTGWNESKVKVRTFRARKRVRETLQKLLKTGKVPKNQRAVNEKQPYHKNY